MSSKAIRLIKEIFGTHRRIWTGPWALSAVVLVALACQPQGQITVSEEELRAMVQDEVDAQLANPSEVVLAAG